MTSDEKASDMAWRLRQQMYGPCRVREEAAAAIIEGQQAENKRLRKALEKLARLGNGEHYGNSEGNVIARKALEVSDEPLGT